MNDLMTQSFKHYVDRNTEARKDLESGPGPKLGPGRIDENLTAFLKKAEEVRKEMNSIKEILARIRASKGRALHKPEALSVLKRARAIQAQLEEMDKPNAAYKRLSGYNAGSPTDRARTNVANGLREKLKELIMEFHAMRLKMAEYKDTVGRRYFTVTGEFPMTTSSRRSSRLTMATAAASP